METRRIGNVGGGRTQSRTVYDADGICPTLCSGMDHGNTIPYIVVGNQMEVKQLGNIMPTKGRDNPNQGRVYDANGLCPALTNMQGGADSR